MAFSHCDFSLRGLTQYMMQVPEQLCLASADTPGYVSAAGHLPSEADARCNLC